MNQSIKTYYEELAGTYDENRFGNTYGRYIDKQEKHIVQQLLAGKNTSKTLDIACGTGRFLSFAQHGIDLSTNMISVAQDKFPDRNLAVSDAAQTPFEAAQFENILCFHLLMHLDKEKTQAVLDEAARILKPGGLFIVDVPSAHRRKLLNYHADGWHGANAYTVSEIQAATAASFQLKSYIGIAFFPIHRLPNRLRSAFIWLDNLLCRSFLKRFSSYFLLILVKK